MKGLYRIAVLLCFSFLAASIARGQQTGAAATVTGQVVDQQGGVLPDAVVILLNGGGIRLQQTKTGPSGDFVFQNLSPSEYIVEAERTGFAHTQQRVTIPSGQPEAPVKIEMCRTRSTGDRDRGSWLF